MPGLKELAPMLSELELVDDCAWDMLLGLNSAAWTLMFGVKAAAFTLMLLLYGQLRIIWFVYE